MQKPLHSGNYATVRTLICQTRQYRDVSEIVANAI